MEKNSMAGKKRKTAAWPLTCKSTDGEKVKNREGGKKMGRRDKQDSNVSRSVGMGRMLLASGGAWHESRRQQPGQSTNPASLPAFIPFISHQLFSFLAFSQITNHCIAQLLYICKLRTTTDCTI
jgi:hypothetical protein